MSNERNFKKINIPKDVDVSTLTPLEISCGSTKCEDDLHCFSLKRTSIRKNGKSGTCLQCGIELANWDRLKQRDLGDAKYLFASLKRELFRHVVWHMKIDQKAIDFAKSKSHDDLKAHVKNVLIKRIKVKTGWDGRQTPAKGAEITNYAQHATATCCKKCIEIWHGIPEEQEIDDAQIDFFTELCMLFIDEKIQETNGN